MNMKILYENVKTGPLQTVYDVSFLIAMGGKQPTRASTKAQKCEMWLDEYMGWTMAQHLLR